MEHPLPLCFSETCNGNSEMEQLISKTSFALKGNGWSRDGYTGIPGAGDK